MPFTPNTLDRKIKFDSWQVMFSLLVAGLAVKALYERFNGELTSFPDRAIGIAVLSGVDASARMFAYFQMIAVFLGVVFLGLALLPRLQNRVERSFNPRWFEIDRMIWFTLSIIALNLLLLAVLTRQQFYMKLISGLLFLIALDFFVVFASYVFFKTNRQRLRLFESYPIRFLAVCFPLAIIFGSWVYLKRPFIFEPVHYAWFIILWLVFYTLYALSLRLYSSRVGVARLDRAWLAAGLPFILIPASIPLANELQFTLSSFSEVSPRQLSGWIIAVLVLSCLALFRLSLGGAARRKPGFGALPGFPGRLSKIVPNLYFPIVIATCALFRYYQPALSIDAFDMFHDGEQWIVAQQAIEFGQLPYLHQLPTHGLSEVYYQFLYSWINGYQPVEPWLWEWINFMLIFILIYHLIKLVIDPLSALLITMLLPVNAFLPLNNNYATLILPALGLFLLTRQPRAWKDGVLLWLICILALLWRLDFGIAVTAAYLLLLGLQILQRAMVHRSSLLQDIGVAAASFAIVFGSSILVYFLAVLLAGESIPENLITNFHFIRILAPAMSPPELVDKFSALAVFQYVLLPGIALFYLGYSLYRVFFRKEAVSTVGWIMVFLGVVSLLLSFRSLQRHALVERYDPYLFGVQLLFLPFYVDKTPKRTSWVLFSLLLASYLMVFPNSNKLVTDGELFKFRIWRDRESRVQLNPEQYGGVVSFLTAELGPGQTFYDFTNSPLLYVLAHKKLVTSIVPNLLTTSESIQRVEVENLEEAHRQGILPFIVFRQGNWWDQVDGVPNEVRSYRIAEFIYAHYQPFATIDGYMLWAQNDLNPNPLPAENAGGNGYQLIPIRDFSQDFNLMKLPFIWGTYDEEAAALGASELAVLLDEPTLVAPDQTLQLNFNPKVDKTTGNYIYLRIQADAAASLSLSYGEGGTSRISFDILPSGRAEDYLVRISSQWEWTGEAVETLSVNASGILEIEQIRILKGD